MSLIVKIILIESILLTLSAPAAEKTQYFAYLSFSSILQLINGIPSDLQKLLTNFNGRAIVAFFKIPFLLSAPMFPNSLAFNT